MCSWVALATGRASRVQTCCPACSRVGRIESGKGMDTERSRRGKYLTHSYGTSLFIWLNLMVLGYLFDLNGTWPINWLNIVVICDLSDLMLWLLAHLNNTTGLPNQKVTMGRCSVFLHTHTHAHTHSYINTRKQLNDSLDWSYYNILLSLVNQVTSTLTY